MNNTRKKLKTRLVRIKQIKKYVARRKKHLLKYITTAKSEQTIRRLTEARVIPKTRSGS